MSSHGPLSMLLLPLFRTITEKLKSVTGTCKPGQSTHRMLEYTVPVVGSVYWILLTFPNPPTPGLHCQRKVAKFINCYPIQLYIKNFSVIIEAAIYIYNHLLMMEFQESKFSYRKQ